MTEDVLAFADTDDMSLNELIDLAHKTVTAYYGWGEWLEHHYDPAKSALVELLQQHGIVGSGDSVDEDYDEAEPEPDTVGAASGTAKCHHCGQRIQITTDGWRHIRTGESRCPGQA